MVLSFEAFANLIQRFRQGKQKPVFCLCPFFHILHDHQPERTVYRYRPYQRLRRDGSLCLSVCIRYCQPVHTDRLHKSFRVGITTVLCGTAAFMVREELKVQSEHTSHLLMYQSEIVFVF